MERKLKERLVGAVFLVLAAVLIIPLFLDGPDNEPTGSRSTVSLPPAEDTDGRTSTVRLDQSRDTPIAAPITSPISDTVDAATAATTESSTGADMTSPAAQSSPPVAVQAAEPAGQTAAPVPAAHTPAPVTATPSATPASTSPTSTAADSGGWVVQLGAYGNPDGAERVVADLRAQRYQGFVTRHEADGRTLHRVRVGPAGTREEADQLQRRLAADGFTGQPVLE